MSGGGCRTFHKKNTPSTGAESTYRRLSLSPAARGNSTPAPVLFYRTQKRTLRSVESVCFRTFPIQKRHFCPIRIQTVFTVRRRLRQQRSAVPRLCRAIQKTLDFSSDGDYNGFTCRAGVAELADARDLKSHTASPVENAENPCKISARRLNDGGFHRLIEGLLHSLKSAFSGCDLHFDLHFPKNFFLQQNICWCGGIGRRPRLKISFKQLSTGSIPVTSTTSSQALYRLRRFSFKCFLKIAGALTPLLLLSAKGPARFACSLVNAVTTAHRHFSTFFGFIRQLRL